MITTLDLRSEFPTKQEDPKPDLSEHEAAEATMRRSSIATML